MADARGAKGIGVMRVGSANSTHFSSLSMKHKNSAFTVRKGFFVWLSAVALGTYLGLWIGSGDIRAELLYHKLKSTRALILTKWTHVEVTGFVVNVRNQDDGDIHVTISDGSTASCGKKDYAFGICIVGEIRPNDQGRIVRPKKGQTVSIKGISRFDKGHGFWEIHPIDAIDLIADVENAFLPELPVARRELKKLER